MKTKPFLIPTIIILIAGLAFFVRCKTTLKTDSSEIAQFLNKFNNSINEGNADTLMTCFKTDKKTKALVRLINLLAGKKGADGMKPLTTIKLDIDKAEIKNISNDLVNVTIPASFSHATVDDKQSVLILKIYKVAPHELKIIQADARQFLTDYLAYENFVKSKTEAGKVTYSAITLAAFKTADQLKTRYDSVIWFAHLHTQTYFYVIKGKWNIDKDIIRDKDSTIDPYKMGLVNPDLKEIIPAEYDLIHNINGTFTGLVEVEKNNKKGFYNLNGRMVVPVDYDEVFPIEDENNLAVLRTGSDYFYLKKDTTVSEKVDLKISDFFSNIKNLTHSFDLYKNALSVVTEYNSKNNHNAVYIPPSYLVELNMISKWENFKNPLRNVQNVDDDFTHKNYEVKYSGNSKTGDNWLEASFYSIRDYFLGGRSEFYDRKNIVIIDKKQNRVFSKEIETDYSNDEGSGSLGGICDINSIKVLNDSLFEVKSTAVLEVQMYDSTQNITEGAYYHYLSIKKNKLIELPNKRTFGFTKYIKMDDSYLSACYNLLIGVGTYDKRKLKTIDHITPEILKYMKNEIYADYRYQFNDKRWQEIFGDTGLYNRYSNTPNNANVDDSLTVIDKYNINWINHKLKEVKPNTLAAR
ncbi:MAG: hypothetical protein JWR12_44 [Mucilaginibacter sp.]|nr:hypothetical protein [Mucilaginibacter sp.]